VDENHWPQWYYCAGVWRLLKNSFTCNCRLKLRIKTVRVASCRANYSKVGVFHKFEMDLGRYAPASEVAGGHTILKLADHALFKMVRYVVESPRDLPYGDIILHTFIGVRLANT
jgi:hypothetical protein